MQKEAKARIKINNLLQSSGWRFFDDEKGTANISLEPIENGVNQNPTIETLTKIAKALEVGVDDLIK